MSTRTISKVSDITITDIADFIRLGEVGDTETTQLNAFLTVAKNYIKNYTGLPLSKYTPTTDEEPKPNKTYYTIVSGVYVKFTGSSFVQGTTYYEQIAEDDVDDYQDLIIVVLILCQDMYDNRAMYVDKNNPNKVVHTILDMHTRVNL